MPRNAEKCLAGGLAEDDVTGVQPSQAERFRSSLAEAQAFIGLGLNSEAIPFLIRATQLAPPEKLTCELLVDCCLRIGKGALAAEVLRGLIEQIAKRWSGGVANGPSSPTRRGTTTADVIEIGDGPEVADEEIDESDIFETHPVELYAPRA